MATKKNGERVASGKEKKSLAKIKEQIDTVAAQAAPWDSFPEEVTGELPGYAAEYISINADIAALERRKEELKESIKGVVALTGEHAVGGEFFVTEMVLSRRPRRVNERLLLAEGITMEVIERCTIGGEEYRYLQVRAKE